VRLSLRHKIAGGFGLLLILMALLGWVTISLFQSIRSTQRQVFADAIPGLVAVEEIVRSYTAQTAAVRGFLIQPHPGLLEQYQREVSQASVWQQEARELFAEEEEQRLLGELVAAGTAFNTLIEEDIIPLAEEGRRSLAFSMLGQQGTPLVSEIETLGARLRAQQDRVVAAAESELGARSGQAVVILALVIGWFGVRKRIDTSVLEKIN
jgi:CHASE3 domain sensor protein